MALTNIMVAKFLGEVTMWIDVDRCGVLNLPSNVDHFPTLSCGFTPGEVGDRFAKLDTANRASIEAHLSGCSMLWNEHHGCLEKILAVDVHWEACVRCDIRLACQYDIYEILPTETASSAMRTWHLFYFAEF